MLRIKRISGEELSIALQEDLLPDVRALKRRLNQLYGLPPSFRQRLLLHDMCFEDTATLHPGMELELFLLVFVPNPSPDEVQELKAAARAGDFDKACGLSDSNIRKPPREQILQRRGLDVWKLKFLALFPDFRLSLC